MKPEFVFRTLPGGKREEIRALIALRIGNPPRHMEKGEAVAIAKDLGVTPSWVSCVAYEMRRGTLPVRGAVLKVVDSLPERLQKLEREQPGLTRVEQARILGTTRGSVRDAAYRLRCMGGHSPRRHRQPASGRVITPATGWMP